MGSKHSTVTRIKDEQPPNQHAWQQPNTPSLVTSDSTQRHTLKSRRVISSLHKHAKGGKPSPRCTIHSDLATVTTILSRYANRLAIENILKEKLGESHIQMADGCSVQQWWIEVRI